MVWLVQSDGQGRDMLGDAACSSSGTALYSVAGAARMQVAAAMLPDLPP
jgi:hypothetical protein